MKGGALSTRLSSFRLAGKRKKEGKARIKLKNHWHLRKDKRSGRSNRLYTFRNFKRRGKWTGCPGIRYWFSLALSVFLVSTISSSSSCETWVCQLSFKGIERVQWGHVLALGSLGEKPFEKLTRNQDFGKGLQKEEIRSGFLSNSHKKNLGKHVVGRGLAAYSNQRAFFSSFILGRGCPEVVDEDTSYSYFNLQFRSPFIATGRRPSLNLSFDARMEEETTLGRKIRSCSRSAAR